LEERLDAIVARLGAVRPLAAGAEERHRQKPEERRARPAVQAPPERPAQGLVPLAQRCDIREEGDRPGRPAAAARAVLKRREPIGRRLDFLIQEMNREANTLGSKAQDEELTRTAVELKVLIEQMREQAQNLE